MYKYFQAYSLDVVLGGVIGALFVARYMGVQLDFFLVAELILTIWLIYTFDHLIDSGSGFYDVITFRHKLHKKYSVTIWGVWGFALVVAFSLLFKIPKVSLWMGMVLVFFVVLYFISLKLLEDGKIYHKEITAAVVYATGIFLAPVSLYHGVWSLDIWVLFLEFVLLAFVNLLIFSLYEREEDQISGFHSLVKAIGESKARTFSQVILVGLLAGSMIFALFNRVQNSIFVSQLIIFAMSMMLILILVLPKFFERKDRYRTTGDLVFFTPAIFLFI